MACTSRRPRSLHAVIITLFLFTVLNPTARAAMEDLYRYKEASEVITDAGGRIRGATSRTGKDFVVGGLFPLHSEDPASDGGRCGRVRSEQLAEAMLFALDRINADTELLQGIELGYDIRDTCFSENIGLDEALDLIVSGERLDVGSCDSSTVTGRRNASESVNTVGIVGAGASKVSVPVASLGRLFEMPQVCYASSSPLLSNRDKYSYFYRTIPPDNLQAKVMVDLMLWFNWTHISTIYSDDAYGQPGIAALQELAEDDEICIDVNEGIGEGFVEDDYEVLAMKLNASAASIVVLFAHDQHVEKLLEKVRTISPGRRFIWIASDTWSRSVAIADRFNETLAGMYGVSPFSPHIHEFEDYLSQLTIKRNLRNPWFPEIFAGYAECDHTWNTTVNACDQNANITHFSQYGQSNLVPLTIDAVYTFAHALNDFLMENCDQPMVWNRADNACNGQRRQLNGSALLEYIAKVRFHSPLTGNIVQFDSEGNVEGRYEIWNYQGRNVNGMKRYEFSKVGIWGSSVSDESRLMNTSSLNFTDVRTLQFGTDGNGSIVREPPQSHCGHCLPGQYRRPVMSSCCSICDPCLGQNFSNEHFAPSCNSCSLLGDMWGNDPLRGSNSCVAISETFLKFSDPWSIVVIFMAIIGLVSAMGTGIVFGVHFKTPVIKSSSREQMILLLIGVALSFVSVFVYIAPPSLGVCIVQRFAIWFCFSLMFGAVMIKILRVARIFLNKSLTRRLRCMDAHHLIILTFLIVLGQIVLVVASIGYQLPGIRRELRLDSTNMNNFPEIVITCVGDPIPMFVLSVAYEALIIIVACVLGVMSFKFPANFNEAKFISFCTFALLMIWLAFIPSYFSTLSTPEIQNATFALAVIMSAFAVLSCIFGRKIYIIVFRPKDNKRHFTSVYTKADNCTTAIDALTIQTSAAFTGHTPKRPDMRSESPSKSR